MNIRFLHKLLYIKASKMNNITSLINIKEDVFVLLLSYNLQRGFSIIQTNLTDTNGETK